MCGGQFRQVGALKACVVTLIKWLVPVFSKARGGAGHSPCRAAWHKLQGFGGCSSCMLSSLNSQIKQVLNLRGGTLWVVHC